MTYISEPLSRKQIRNVALQLRELLGIENEYYFPVIQLLENILPLLFPNFYYEVVPVSAFPPNKHADMNVVNHCIRIRKDIYYGAVSGNGRDRMTIVHEISHYILISVCGVKFNRTFEAVEIKTYQDPEWQAKALAGELMCPHHLIANLSVHEIMDKCVVSEQAAKYNLLKCRSVM